jgi:anti-anti-sigma factor
MSAVRSPVPEDAELFEFWTVRLDASRAALGASGELDLAAVRELRRMLITHERSGRVFIRLDLSAVTFMDCSCLAILASIHRRLLAVNGQLILTEVSEPVARLLVLTGLDAILLSTAMHDGLHSLTEVRPAIGARP